MPMVYDKKHKYVGLEVPVYYQTEKRVPEGSIFKRRPTDRFEARVRILEVKGIWSDTVMCKVEFLDTPAKVTATRYIDPDDIAAALEDKKTSQPATV